MSEAASEMPKYQCHKQVWALRIKNIEVFEQGSPNALAGAACITPFEIGYAPFFVDQAYLDKHNPQIGGYYVVYDDGYKSWSPAQAFEQGYTRII
jgi:hypothetical protein